MNPDEAGCCDAAYLHCCSSSGITAACLKKTALVCIIARKSIALTTWLPVVFFAATHTSLPPL